MNTKPLFPVSLTPLQQHGLYTHHSCPWCLAPASNLKRGPSGGATTNFKCSSCNCLLALVDMRSPPGLRGFSHIVSPGDYSKLVASNDSRWDHARHNLKLYEKALSKRTKYASSWRRQWWEAFFASGAPGLFLYFAITASLWVSTFIILKTALVVAEVFYSFGPWTTLAHYLTIVSLGYRALRPPRIET